MIEEFLQREMNRDANLKVATYYYPDIQVTIVYDCILKMKFNFCNYKCIYSLFYKKNLKL